MNNYASGHQRALFGCLMAPFAPFVVMSLVHHHTFYRPTLPECVVLWLVALATIYLLIAIHELGHVAAARLGGISIETVNIGQWKPWCRFRVGSVAVFLRWLPALGYVRCVPCARLLQPGPYSAFALGGVAAEGLFIGTVAFLPAPDTFATFGDAVYEAVRWTIFIVGGLHVLGSLWPFSASDPASGLVSDGTLLRIYWQQRHKLPETNQHFADWTDIEKSGGEGRTNEACQKARLLHQRSPNLPALISALGRFGALDEAITLGREQIVATDTPRDLRIHYIDVLCTFVLIANRRDLVPAALDWLEEARLLAPEAITLQGTYSGLLTEAGRHDEARPILERVLAISDLPIDIGFSAAFLAKIHHARGDAVLSARYAAQARQRMPNDSLVRRILSDIENHE